MTEDKLKTLDVMIDIETLGVGQDSAVLSIAAVQFNRTDIYDCPNLSITEEQQGRDTEKYPSKFYKPISLLNCLALGCVIDPSTAKFWECQENKEQLGNSLVCNDSVYTVLSQLKTYLDGHCYQNIWAKSPTFDISILRSLGQRVGVDLGIDFRKERDVRTEISDYPRFDVREISKQLKVVDSHNTMLGLHHPLYDCIIQIQAIQEVYALKRHPVVVPLSKEQYEKEKVS